MTRIILINQNNYEFIDDLSPNKFNLSKVKVKYMHNTHGI